MNDCQRLEEDDNFNSNASPYEDEDRLMDYTYSYALSLAMCDLSVARQTIPYSCRHFQDSTLVGLSTKDRKQEMHVTHEQIQACVSSLYLDNNSWTSFTSNKGKATLLCQASRIDIQKGKHLDLSISIYKLIQIDQIIVLHEETGKALASFNEALQNQHAQYMRDLDERDAATKSSFDRVLRMFGIATEKASTMFGAVFEDISCAAKVCVHILTHA